MKPKELRFRYGSAIFNGEAGLKAVLRVGLVMVLVLGAIAGAGHDEEALFAAGSLGLVVAAVVFFRSAFVKGLIVIGRRFVVVNQDIFFYQNLSKVRVESDKGLITLFKQSYPACVIKQADFPTNARHEPKITNNRRSKFNKVQTKLLERIQAAAPELPIQK